MVIPETVNNSRYFHPWGDHIRKVRWCHYPTMGFAQVTNFANTAVGGKKL